MSFLAVFQWTFPNVAQTIAFLISVWPFLVRSLSVLYVFAVKSPEKPIDQEHYVKLKRGLKLNFNVVVSCTGNLITKHHSSGIRVGCRVHLEPKHR